MIIGIAGKKQSGKTTLCEYLKVWCVINQDDRWKKLFTVSQHDDQVTIKRDKDDDCKDQDIKDLLVKVQSFAKIYSFADPLKTLVCNKVMGLPLDKLYGTDEDKNSLTDYLWDNLPKEARLKFSESCVSVCTGTTQDSFGEEAELMDSIVEPRTGRMTVREVLQFIGTDVFRKMFDDNTWVNAVFRMIDDDKPEIALISDVRFKTEIKSIVDRGGYIVHLERSSHLKDSHSSEVDLDNFDFRSLGDRCFTVNNSYMDISEKNDRVIDWMNRILNA